MPQYSLWEKNAGIFLKKKVKQDDTFQDILEKQHYSVSRTKKDTIFKKCKCPYMAFKTNGEKSTIKQEIVNDYIKL